MDAHGCFQFRQQRQKAHLRKRAEKMTKRSKEQKLSRWSLLHLTMADQMPVRFQPLLDVRRAFLLCVSLIFHQLAALGVPATSIGFQNLTLQSDKFITVRDEQNVTIYETANPSTPQKRPIQAESAIMHPSLPILALKCSRQFSTHPTLPCPLPTPEFSPPFSVVFYLKCVSLFLLGSSPLLHSTHSFQIVLKFTIPFSAEGPASLQALLGLS